MGPLTATIRLLCPEKILLIYGSTENLLTTSVSQDIVREILGRSSLPSTEIAGRYCDFVFTFCQRFNDELQGKLVTYLTNTITVWACCSHTLQHACVALGKDARPLIYTKKTGLDILSRFIGTSKLVNKLGLDDVKYMNLQYLYLLVLYIKFMEHKSSSSKFFFDDKYFRSEKGCENFLRSKGKGLEMVAEAHKTLSYVFLTKPDLMDQFLFYNTHGFLLHLKRLLKITQFDLTLLSYLSNYYISTDRLSELAFNSSFCFEALFRDRVNPATTKVELFASHYESLQTACLRKRRIFPSEDLPYGSGRPSTDKESGDDADAVAKILRSLLW